MSLNIFIRSSQKIHLPSATWRRLYSILMSRLLNDTCYHKNIVRKRQQHFSEASKIVENENLTKYICGSSREGLNLVMENDFDFMTFPKLFVGVVMTLVAAKD